MLANNLNSHIIVNICYRTTYKHPLNQVTNILLKEVKANNPTYSTDDIRGKATNYLSIHEAINNIGSKFYFLYYYYAAACYTCYKSLCHKESLKHEGTY